MAAIHRILTKLTLVQRVEVIALPLLALIAAILWSAPIRAERALRHASFNELRALSRRQPDNPRVFYHLGARLRDLGQLGPATAAFARAAFLDPENEETWIAWGTTAAAFGRYQDAFEALSRCAQTHPHSPRSHLTLALFCHEHFALQRAYDEALAASRCDAGDASAWRLAGVTAMQLQDLPAAESALARATALSPSDWRSHLALGQVLAARHRLPDALGSFRRASRLAPQEGTVTLLVGQIELVLASNSAETEAARATLQLASQQTRDSADVSISLGQALVRLRRWPEARAVLENAVRLRPNDAAARFELARVYRQLGDDRAAERETQAHARIKEYDETRLSLGSRARTTNDPSVRLKLARLCAAHGDIQEAEVEYHRILTQAPGEPDAKRELASLERRHVASRADADGALAPASAPAPAASVALLLRDADSVLARGRYPEAERAYIQIARIDPNSAMAYQGAGLAMVGEGRTEDAFHALQRALSLDPHLPEAQFALAKLYYDQGFVDEAARRMETLTRQVPSNPAYLHAFASCIIDDSSRYTECEQILQRAVALDSSQPTYWRDLARTQANLNGLDTAEKSFRKALSLDPARSESAVNLGVFLLDHNPTPARQQEADRLLRQVVARDASNADALLGLGREALIAGDIKNAVVQLGSAVAHDPNLAPAWYHLARAYDRSGDSIRAQDCRAAFNDITSYRKELSDTEEKARYNLKDSKLRLKLARLYARGGQFARAINQYQVCLSLDRSSTSVRRELEKFTTRLRSHGEMPSMTALNGLLLASAKAH